MLRKVFLAVAASAIAGVCLMVSSPLASAAAAAPTMNVQVRVYRLQSPGIYHFYPGVRVQLNDGRFGTTSNGDGQRGCAYFYKVPVRNYTARAWVNGRWYSATSYQRFGSTLRINVQLP